MNSENLQKPTEKGNILDDMLRYVQSEEYRKMKDEFPLGESLPSSSESEKA